MRKELGSFHCGMKWRVCSYVACLGCGVDLLATRDQLMAVCVFSLLSNIELCTGLLPGGIICLLIFASQPCYPINSDTHNSVIVSSYMKSNKWTINTIVCKLLVSPLRWKGRFNRRHFCLWNINYIFVLRPPYLTSLIKYCPSHCHNSATAHLSTLPIEIQSNVKSRSQALCSIGIRESYKH